MESIGDREARLHCASEVVIAFEGRKHHITEKPTDHPTTCDDLRGEQLENGVEMSKCYVRCMLGEELGNACRVDEQNRCIGGANARIQSKATATGA